MDVEPVVFIVDDDPASRQALAAVAKAMHLRVEAFSSSQQLMEGRNGWPPACILVHIDASSDGVDAVRDLTAIDPRPPVVCLAAQPNPRAVVRAVKAGAVDFLPMPCMGGELREVIAESLAWDTENRRHQARQTRAQRRIASLSDGERDVLAMLVNGRRNGQIADELGLSVRAVEVRRAKIMRKTGTRSLAELVRLWLTSDSPPGTAGSPGVRCR